MKDLKVQKCFANVNFPTGYTSLHLANMFLGFLLIKYEVFCTFEEALRYITKCFNYYR